MRNDKGPFLVRLNTNQQLTGDRFDTYLKLFHWYRNRSLKHTFSIPTYITTSRSMA